MIIFLLICRLLKLCCITWFKNRADIIAYLIDNAYFAAPFKNNGFFNGLI